ncbi:hypothetical protein E2C01_095782 [Portunus trituberculatus]|uniref:Uncharacterized protein n=1 Tax=Portunus trituberculatus TaxID=210409 RepID=A0A5B7K4X7_PORTR|nr:hypothetical protein [Portunus trituberculatus]
MCRIFVYVYRTLYYCDACVPLPFPPILPSRHPFCGSVSQCKWSADSVIFALHCASFPHAGVFRWPVEEWTQSGGVEAKECVLTVDEKWQEVEADEC